MEETRRLNKMVDRITTSQDRRNFLDMCKRLISKKGDAKRRELEKLNKGDDKGIDAVIDVMQKDYDKSLKELELAFTQRVYEQLGKHIKGKKKRNLFADSYCVDVQEVVDDEIGDPDEWIDDAVDKYEAKLNDKLFEIEQELMFADLPRLQKMFEDLKKL